MDEEFIEFQDFVDDFFNLELSMLTRINYSQWIIHWIMFIFFLTQA